MWDSDLLVTHKVSGYKARLPPRCLLSRRQKVLSPKESAQEPAMTWVCVFIPVLMRVSNITEKIHF